MWCDNCLLLLPLRAGAIAWAVVIFAYSIAGGIFLLRWGNFLFFVYPEWLIYGGIGLAIGAAALVNMIALSNRSYIWTRVCKFIWPLIIILSGIRAILMIVELERGQYKILWECQNGGVQWVDPTSTTVPADASLTIPTPFCKCGFSSVNTAFIISLLADLGFQIYMAFLNWRFSKRLEHYNSMKGPYYGGYYNA